MTAPAEQSGLSFVGKLLMVYFSLLFGWEVIAPYFYPAGASFGDANTKAVLTNLVIALWAYLLGRNEGSQQKDNAISKLVDANKKAQDVIAASAVNPEPAVILQPGESAKAAEIPTNGNPDDPKQV